MQSSCLVSAPEYPEWVHDRLTYLFGPDKPDIANPLLTIRVPEIAEKVYLATMCYDDTLDNFLKLSVSILMTDVYNNNREPVSYRLAIMASDEARPLVDAQGPSTEELLRDVDIDVDIWFNMMLDDRRTKQGLPLHPRLLEKVRSEPKKRLTTSPHSDIPMRSHEPRQSGALGESK